VAEAKKLTGGVRNPGLALIGKALAKQHLELLPILLEVG
jgi:hypothetical protein